MLRKSDAAKLRVTPLYGHHPVHRFPAQELQPDAGRTAGVKVARQQPPTDDSYVCGIADWQANVFLCHRLFTSKNTSYANPE